MSSWTDDSSALLGLTHSSTGEPIDARGRKIVALPPSTDGYRPDLVDKSPAEMAEILAADEASRADRQSEDGERLMREVPGGPTGAHGSSSGRRRARKPGTYDRTEPIIASEPTELRPNVISARVSMLAYRGIYRADNPSPGEMIEVLGIAIAMAGWQAVASALQSCACP